MATIVILFWGQSNITGIDATATPGGLPLAAVRFYRQVNSSGNYLIRDHVYQDLQESTAGGTIVTSHYGPELKCGIDLNAAGHTVRIGKASINGTHLAADWAPGGATNFGRVLGTLAMLRPKNTTENPTYYLVTGQGEAEAADGVSTAAAAWAADFATFRAPICTFLGEEVRTIITKTGSPTGGQLAIVQAQQAAAAAAIPGGRGYLLDIADFSNPVANTIDGTHWNGATRNNWGAALATQIIAML